MLGDGHLEMRTGLLLGCSLATSYLGVKAYRNWKKECAVEEMISRRFEEAEKNKKKVIDRFSRTMKADQTAIVAMELPELRQRLQDGRLSAVKVLEAYLTQAVRVNFKTNAITEFILEAFEQAEELDKLEESERGPLHGVPISLKEHINLKGKDCTVGIPNNIGKPMPRDAAIVRALKKLGAVPFCRTNLPQTCCSFDCSNPIFGITRNPIRRKISEEAVSPGGSSGGEAALLVKSGSLIGIGSDLGGSVRIPAAFCGITSLKPTSGRLPLSGQGSDGGLIGVVGASNTLGFMARSAETISEAMAQLLDEKYIGNVDNDARFIPLPWRADKVPTKKSTIRIGWYDYDNVVVAVPAMRRGVQVAIDVLKKMGHEVVEFTPSVLPEVAEIFGTALTADEGVSTQRLLSYSPIDQSIELFWKTITLPEWLRRLAAPIVYWWSPSIAASLVSTLTGKQSWKLWDLQQKRLDLVETYLREMEEKKVDVVIAPGMATTAVPYGFPAWILGLAVSYTSAYNVLNFPAGSVPVSRVSQEDLDNLDTAYPGAEVDIGYKWIRDGCVAARVGRSINVQVIGKPWQEETVLAVMQELEQNLDNNTVLRDPIEEGFGR